MSQKNHISTKERLRHILKETNFLKSVISQLSNIQEFEQDEIIRRATERSLQIIGEAV